MQAIASCGGVGGTGQPQRRVVTTFATGQDNTGRPEPAGVLVLVAELAQQVNDLDRVGSQAREVASRDGAKGEAAQTVERAGDTATAAAQFSGLAHVRRSPAGLAGKLE